MSAPTITLNTGAGIPQIGLGTWPLDDAQAADAVVAAVEIGYRHIDTATKYGNEKGVGDGVRQSGIAREEIFLTTKLDGAFQGDDRAIGGLEAALERMGTDYVDLLLIHWPLPQRGLFVDTWRTFEKLHERGLARAIGVSNFRPEHLETLLAETDVVPAVNQIQLDPRITRDDHRAFHAEHGIVTESWSPLGGQGADVLQEEVVQRIAAAHGRTPAQVVIRWHVQNGFVVIPKSSSPERMRENLDVFGFELTADDLVALAALSQGPSAGVDSNTTGH